MTSPATDAGAMDASALPSTDLSGSARIVEGNGNGAAKADMGAFEYHNHPPVMSAGDDLTIDLARECLAEVTLNALASEPDGDALTLTWSGPGRQHLWCIGFVRTARPAATQSL